MSIISLGYYNLHQFAFESNLLPLKSKLVPTGFTITPVLASKMSPCSTTILQDD